MIYPDVEHDRVTWRDLEVPWAGTAVGIDLTLTEDQGFAELLRLVGRAYDVDVRDQKKALFRARFGRAAHVLKRP